MTGGRRAHALMVCAALLLAACGGGGPEVPTATVPAAPATTTTVDFYAVPEVIDASYVNRVLAGLDAADGEITRLVVRDRTISQEAGVRLRALYTGDSLQLSLDLLQYDLERGLPGYRPDAGNQRTLVADLISADSSCVFVRSMRDYSAVSESAQQEDTAWIAIVPRGADPDLARFNPTGWQYVYDGFQPGGLPPRDPCIGR